MRSPVVSGALALLVIQGLAGPALAQAPSGRPSDPAAARAEAEGARAAALRTQGEELFAEGNFSGAIQRLRAAWALRKEAPTVILLGEAELKMGRFADAAGHLAAGLSMLGQGKERARVQALFDEARPRVGGIQVVVNVAGATVIAGTFVGETPIEEVFTDPGDVKLTVKKTGHGEQQRVVKTAAGKTTRVEVNLSASGSAVGGTGAEAAPRWTLWPAYVAGGLGLCALGVGVGLRLSGDGKGAEADDLLSGISGLSDAPCSAASPPEQCATIKGLRADHDTLVNASTGLFVGGAVLIAGAVGYGALASRKNRGLAVLPAGSRTGAGLLVLGSF